RAVSTPIAMAPARRDASGMLLATPQWEAVGLDRRGDAATLDAADHHVVLCEMPSVDLPRLTSRLHDSRCDALDSGQQHDIGRRYSDHALACFERLQALARGRPAGRVIVQIVVPDHREQSVFAGLSALLRTAALEHPQIAGQLVLVEPGITPDDLARRLGDE